MTEAEEETGLPRWSHDTILVAGCDVQTRQRKAANLPVGA